MIVYKRSLIRSERTEPPGDEFHDACWWTYYKLIATDIQARPESSAECSPDGDTAAVQFKRNRPDSAVGGGALSCKSPWSRRWGWSTKRGLEAKMAPSNYSAGKVGCKMFAFSGRLGRSVMQRSSGGRATAVRRGRQLDALSNQSASSVLPLARSAL